MAKKKPAPKVKTLPELKLYAHWMGQLRMQALKAGKSVELPNNASAFFSVCNRVDLGIAIQKVYARLEDAKFKVAECVSCGFPLTESEYYLAVALRFIMPRETGIVPYVTFFLECWHETATHQSYGIGGKQKCHVCAIDAKKAKE